MAPLLCVGMVLFVLLTSTGAQSQFHEIQIRDVQYSSKSSTRNIENLKRMLEYVCNSQEFQPFRMSLLLFVTESSELDFLLHHIARGNIQGYRISASEFVSKCTWKDETSLTWIIPIDDIHDLQAFVYLQQELWKSNNQYLIFYAGEETPVKIWRKIFEKLWEKFNVYRILVASIADDFRCFLGYRPFDIAGVGFGKVHKSCLDDVDEDRYIEKYDSRTRRDDINNPVTSLLSRNVSLFEKFEDVNGYPIKVTVFPSLMMYIDVDENNTIHYTKLDAKVMTMLERGMHANFDINVFYKSQNEDPFQRSLKSINDHESEAIITSFFVKTYDESTYLYEFTAGITEDKLCFVAPTRGYLPKSYMPFMPFTKEIWLILAIYNFLATIFWVILRYLSYTFHTNKPVARPLAKTPKIPRKKLACDIASKETSHSTRNNAKPREIHPHVIACTELIVLLCYPFERAYTTAQRVFLCGALFFGLIISGIYHSCLVSTLSKPLKYPEINTIEDVVNSNFTIITKYPNLKSSTFIENEPLDIKLKNKITVLNSEKPTNYFVAYDRTVIALGRFSSVKLENYSVYYDDDGNRLIHIVEECPATYILSYVVRLHSPYIERINTLLLRMQEFGLVRLWYQEMMNPLQIEEEKRKVALSERKVKLTLEHYSLTFLGLFLGLTGCFLVFLGEIYYARCGNC
ncbi:hypothetical protein KPH14_009437 [Odynerus spinipes]|uniref:Ionotropic receptor n=1 Tax=Odynerus spinipes TaxID=1348599 RepID=A0AAD9RPP1_9HYME|nr:hypothetical protein KPH14_009437 [Odynerus spinipes]